MTAWQHPDSHGGLDFVRVGSWVLDHAAIIRPSEKAAGRVREKPANRRRRLVTRHLRRTSAAAAVDSRGFEPRPPFAKAGGLQLHHGPIRPAKEPNLPGPSS